jgi:HSP20 family molecular chaperone IbpA
MDRECSEWRLDRDGDIALQLKCDGGERAAMIIRRGFGLEDFQRSFDEFFDELLIDRWRGATSDTLERGQVLDGRDHYQVRVAAAGVDPSKIDIEVIGQRLTVRVPAQPGGMIEHKFVFSEAVDGDKTTARWSEGTLIITLPKGKGRRIALKET